MATMILLIVVILLLLAVILMLKGAQKEGKTDVLRAQLESLERNLSDRMNQTTLITNRVSESLGTLKEKLGNLDSLNERVNELNAIFSSPKLRGGMGEFLMENLISSVIPKGFYDFQHRFQSGETVDAAIFLGERIVPVDSKFPLENFKKMLTSTEETEKERARKGFFRDSYNHIDAISRKYIKPDEGTIDFALMYIPAENVYYELLVNGPEKNIYEFSLQRKVIPVSPSTFLAYLQTISAGIKGYQLEKNVKAVLEELSSLQHETEHLERLFGTLGGHIENTSKKYYETIKCFQDFTTRLRNILKV